MSVCSRHMLPVAGCVLCATRIEDVLPNYAELRAEGEASGLLKCARCSFEYYAVASCCPKCGASKP